MTPPPAHPVLRPLPLAALLDSAIALFRRVLVHILRYVLPLTLALSAFWLVLLVGGRQPVAVDQIAPLRAASVVEFANHLVGVATVVPWGRAVFDISRLLVMQVALTTVLAPRLSRWYVWPYRAALLPQENRVPLALRLIPGVVLLLPLSLCTGVVMQAARDGARELRIASAGFGFPHGWTLLWAYGPALYGALALLALVTPLLLSATVCAAENCGAFAGVVRSVRLSVRRPLPVLGVAVAVSGLTAAVVLLPSLAALFLSARPMLFAAPTFTTQVAAIVAQLLEALMYPIQLAAFAVLYVDLRVRVEGYDLYEQAQRLCEAEARVLAGPSIACLRAGDLPGALTHLDRGLRLAPTDVALRTVRMTARTRAGSGADALEDATQLTVLLPDDPAAKHNQQYLTAMLEGRADLWPTAMQRLRLPNIVEAAYTRAATMHYRAGDLHTSRQMLDQLLWLDPDHGWALYNSACVLARLGEVEPALDRLAAAFDHGLTWRQQARTDPDLATLHADPRFGALLNEGMWDSEPPAPEP